MTCFTKCSRSAKDLCTLWFLLVAFTATISVVLPNHFDTLDENIFYHISWPGPMSDFMALQQQEEKTPSKSSSAIVMTTVNDEKYKCILPSSESSDDESDQEYQGPSALELISPLFTKFTCIFRFEKYWVYELCHGRHLKQYHEEKESGKPEVKLEYYLGKYDISDFTANVQQFKQEHLQVHKVLHRNVEGIIMPYITINMTDGTQCDLSGRPRTTNVHYACHPALKQEIYSVEETVTCEYEILVLTDLLCEHPDYRPKTPITNEIHCHAIDGTRQRPMVLQNLETESLILNPSSPLHSIKMQFNAFKELNDADELHAETKPKSSLPEMTPIGHDEEPTSPAIATTDDKKIVQEFLEGRHCLHGGSGWWKYEFCFGKKVEQYHEDSGLRKYSIILGRWDKDGHLKWLLKNPHKKPKPGQRRHVSQYFGEGDFCIEAAASRQVEVKLRCKDSTDHPNAVSLYLLEPRICEYILVVESPILCSLLPNADDNGLFRHI